MECKSLIVEIPPEKQEKRGWVVEVNGEILKNAQKVRISNPRFGELNYGLTAPGYDGWSFHEIGGGGSVTVPYAFVEGKLHIGVVEQNRHNQGGVVLNVPRGFLNPGEKHYQTAVREASEEMGMKDKNIEERIFRLEGAPCNPNSAFFETPEPEEGVKFYSFYVLENELVKKEGQWVFNQDVLVPVSKDAKSISQCRFVPWKDVSLLSDMFSVAAVARLLARILT